MILIALLGIPLLAGGLLVRARGSAVGALHGTASVGVVAAGLAVAAAGAGGCLSRRSGACCGSTDSRGGWRC